MASRLAEFSIDGLFGLYSHRIPLNDQERITIIIGPNGRGKTVCLKCIEALFRKNFNYFAEIPFRKAEFRFHDGRSIVIDRKEREPAEERNADDDQGDGPSSVSIRITLTSPGKEDFRWVPKNTDRQLRREIRMHIPSSWRYVGGDNWVDRVDGEVVAQQEIIERFGVPARIAALKSDVPKEIGELINDIDCHLIETQRLLVLPTNIDDTETLYTTHRRFRESRLAIQQKALKLKAILKDTLSESANLSQSLDRSFRVFEARGPAQLSQRELREELESLDQRREALMSAGILDKEYEAAKIPAGNIDPGRVVALEIYVSDAKKKLDVFTNIRSKIDLFKEIIESRFIDKMMFIDRDAGLRIKSKTGHAVPLDKLSSGEQHQLIIVFDLLFEVTNNSLILIDEPELSLHVAWQKTFIDSLKRMIALNAFDVVLATHSPAVVARHFSLAVELGPVDE